MFSGARQLRWLPRQNTRLRIKAGRAIKLTPERVHNISNEAICNAVSPRGVLAGVTVLADVLLSAIRDFRGLNLV